MRSISRSTMKSRRGSAPTLILLVIIVLYCCICFCATVGVAVVAATQEEPADERQQGSEPRGATTMSQQQQQPPKTNTNVMPQSSSGLKVKDFPVVKSTTERTSSSSSSSSDSSKSGDRNSDNIKKKKTTTTLSLQPIQLTSQNFATTITTTDVWLVEFYTPWCTHCQNFQHSYSNIAKAFHSTPDERIRVAKVDCSVEKALMTRFNIAAFPSFVVISGWDVYEFSDPRSESNLMSFARGGYKKKDPIPLMASPMGPMGLLQGTLIYLGTNVMGLFQWIHDQYGISPVLAGMSLIFVFVFGGMISIVLLTILFTPKEKND